MKTVWKFQLITVNKQTIIMPEGAEVLCIQIKGSGTFGQFPCMWALVDPSAPRVPRTFLTYGSGNPIDGSGRYVGTYQLRGGDMVFHVFEACE